MENEDEVLDEELNSDCNCEKGLVKKTLKEKLIDVLIVFLIWIPMFYLIEKFFLDDGGHIYRSLFYAGSITGYLCYVLFNPIYKKKK